MRRTSIAAIVLALVGVLGLLAHAEDAPRSKDAPKAEPPKALKPPFDEADVKRAEELLKPVRNHEYAVLCGLRYLLSPSFEDELFVGRWRPVCPIAPFEQLADGPLSVSEQVRLWAVLETGMARNDAMDAQFSRLLKTPAPEVKHELVNAGVYMLLLRSTLSRLTLAEGAKLIESARATLAACKSAANACSPQSKWVTNEGVEIAWYANHFWRGVINRCALELGLGVDFKLWSRDLDFLKRAFVENKGWTCRRNQPPDIAQDVHANLLAMAAFGLAAGAPPAQFDKSATRTLELAAKRVPGVLKRIIAEYPDLTFVGGRALLLLAAQAAPEGEKDPVAWRAKWVKHTEEQTGTGTAPILATQMPEALGLDAESGGVDLAEAALALSCLCGGLFGAGAGPLEKRSIAELGRLFHALAMVEASKAPDMPPPGPTELDKRVEVALERCRQHLLRMQNDDGSFSPSDRAGRRPGTGPDCLALWALMHCGESRNSKAVQRCMKYLEGRAYSYDYGTYEIGLQLCMLEKYFETEIVASGMYLAQTFEAREEARKKLRESMPRMYANLVDNNVKLLEDAWLGDGYGYGRGGFNWSDNSNSQFAMLGMRAAVALGSEIKVEVFAREAKRLFATFGAVSAFPLVPLERPWKQPSETATDSATKVRPGGWCYMGGAKDQDAKRAAVPLGCSGGGLCSLAIALDELALRKTLKADDELVADKCLSAGLAALTLCGVRLFKAANEQLRIERERAPKARKEREKQAKPKRDPNDWESFHVDMLVECANPGNGRGLFYDLWAMERAFVIAGAETIQGYTWYPVIAEYLLSCQMPDGGWRPKNFTGQYGGMNNLFISTSWAALILRRVGPPVWAPSRRGPGAAPRPGKPVRPETSEPEPKPTEGPVTPGK